ncbi:cellulase family glycosylhydrolase [Flavihumibacter sp. UBA7668]|uniref:cellulase family glycosylhydrolase n=1 Tax=Flavihumibacter sp. UBA7668 TaxID=1946542 RepID=UPI0025C60B9D|nr:cellulase family glycosylhydrolase [Flavihumibacter sp. UBA7668]
MIRKKIQISFLATAMLVMGLLSCNNATETKENVSAGNEVRTVWSLEKAKDWYNQQAWMVGANFLPSTAINQLEMWQAESFDTATINRELGWASAIGMNTMRVYLHSKAWEQDSSGFLNRMDIYLGIADANKIKTIFVIFDDVWNKEPKIGKQPDPKPGTHNSGWVQDPGDPFHKDSTLFPSLEKYVKAVISRFAKDKRVLLWDLYNEPGNSGKKTSSLPLLKNVFTWARSVNPDQPLSAGVWDWSFEELNEFQVANSDILTYHNYEDADMHKRVIQLLKMHGRPMICTEYMARTRNSFFSTVLPLLKEKNVGAINWGLVAGKSNTIYAWDTPIPDGSEPKVWFHDIFRKDGSPYSKEEIELIKKLTQ